MSTPSAFPSKVLGVGCWVLGFATPPAQHPTPNTRAESALGARSTTDIDQVLIALAMALRIVPPGTDSQDTGTTNDTRTPQKFCNHCTQANWFRGVFR